MKPKAKLPAAAVRSRVVAVRMTNDDYRRVKGDADSLRITMSTYLMFNALGRPLGAKSTIALVNELRRQGGLIKHLFFTMQDSNDHTLLPALEQAVRDIQSTIKAVGKDSEA